MGKSIGKPEPVPPGKINEPQSGSLLQAQWRRGKLYHNLSEDGITAEYEIHYQIGAGKVGHSYAVLAKDFLLESPASYYRRYGWDVSPGYAGSELLDFNRVLTARCLFCHSNPPNFFQEKRLTANDLIAISCERCHGETAEHVRRPSSANIVNPAKLPVRARDSICEQCHLEGVARVLNPGKSLSDFRPGKNLEDTMVTYVARQPGSDVTAVSQEEQLALSRCAIESRGKLWCGTCHNPHRPLTDAKAEIKAVCESCHTTVSAPDHANKSECVSCHMPRRSPSDVTHAAITDHRIRAKPEQPPPLTPALPQTITAWREPRPDLQQRDLGLAYMRASQNPHFRGFGEAGATLLKGLPLSQQNADPEAMAAQGDAALSQGHTADALSFFRRARELDPSSAEYALYLGIALERNADLAGARSELQQAIQLDRSLQRAYLELSAIDVKQGRVSDAASVLDQYLQFDPQSILIRLTRETLIPGKK